MKLKTLFYGFQWAGEALQMKLKTLFYGFQWAGDALRMKLKTLFYGFQWAGARQSNMVCRSKGLTPKLLLYVSSPRLLSLALSSVPCCCPVRSAPTPFLLLLRVFPCPFLLWVPTGAFASGELGFRPYSHFLQVGYTLSAPAASSRL
jgi:hypothetical protein